MKDAEIKSQSALSEEEKKKLSSLLEIIKPLLSDIAKTTIPGNVTIYYFQTLNTMKSDVVRGDTIQVKYETPLNDYIKINNITDKDVKNLFDRISDIKHAFHARMPKKVLSERIEEMTNASKTISEKLFGKQFNDIAVENIGKEIDKQVAEQNQKLAANWTDVALNNAQRDADKQNRKLEEEKIATNNQRGVMKGNLQLNETFYEIKLDDNDANKSIGDLSKRLHNNAAELIQNSRDILKQSSIAEGIILRPYPDLGLDPQFKSYQPAFQQQNLQAANEQNSSQQGKIEQAQAVLSTTLDAMAMAQREKNADKTFVQEQLLPLRNLLNTFVSHRTAEGQQVPSLVPDEKMEKQAKTLLYMLDNVEKGSEELMQAAASEDKEKTKSAWNQIREAAGNFINAFRDFLQDIVNFITNFKGRDEDKNIGKEAKAFVEKVAGNEFAKESEELKKSGFAEKENLRRSQQSQNHPKVLEDSTPKGYSAFLAILSKKLIEKAKLSGSELYKY